MRKTGPSAQERFVFGALACPVCPYGLSGRCKGERAATLESFTLNNSTVVGCRDPARQRIYYSDLHSHIPRGRRKSRHHEIHLPELIPLLGTGLGRKPEFRNDTLFGVSLSTILDGEGRIKYRSAEALRHTLKLPLTARIALIGTARDYTIERFWERSDSLGSWERLAALGFEFSTSLTYSVWDKHPRFHQILSQEKNLVSHDLLLSHGVRSIPFLFFYDAEDYQSVLSWLDIHRDVRKIAMLAQFHRSRAGFAEMLDDMARLERDVGREIQFLVVGPSSANRLTQILDHFALVSIATHQPIMKAIRGRRTMKDLRHEPVDRRIPKAQLAVHNVELYRRSLSGYRITKRARLAKDLLQKSLLS